MKDRKEFIEENDDTEFIETISLELEDGTIEECEVLDILEIDGKKYISLLPLDSDEYFIYECKVVNDEIEIINITDNNVYEKVMSEFEEYYSFDDEDEE